MKKAIALRALRTGNRQQETLGVKLVSAFKNVLTLMRSAIVARYGGEEFTILLANTTLDGAIPIAQRIQRQLPNKAIPHSRIGIGGIVTFSIGLAAIIPQHNISLELFIHQADQHLYQAKALRTQSICFSQPTNIYSDRIIYDHEKDVNYSKIIYIYDY